MTEITDPVDILRYLLEDELDDSPFARGNAILWSEVERLATFDEALRDDVVARRTRYDATVEAQIRAAQDSGAVPRHVDAVTSARMLTALVDGLGLALRVGGRSRDEVRATLARALTTELGVS